MTGPQTKDEAPLPLRIGEWEWDGDRKAVGSGCTVIVQEHGMVDICERRHICSAPVEVLRALLGQAPDPRVAELERKLAWHNPKRDGLDHQRHGGPHPESDVKWLNTEHRCTCGSGAHPRTCLRHPLGWRLHTAELRDDLAFADDDDRGPVALDETRKHVTALERRIEQAVADAGQALIVLNARIQRCYDSHIDNALDDLGQALAVLRDGGAP